MKRGKFVSFEGIEGCGKTTQIALLSRALNVRQISHTVTREPGGSSVGDGIRKILLHSSNAGLTPEAELLLFYASRHQNIVETIEPALVRGELVICDRFYHASMAYQGYGRGLRLEFIETLTDLVCGRHRPDVIILLDIEPTVGLARARSRNSKQQEDEGRFEMETLAFYRRVRDGYLEIASREPDRIRVLEADRSVETVHQDILNVLGV